MYMCFHTYDKPTVTAKCTPLALRKKRANSRWSFLEFVCMLHLEHMSMFHGAPGGMSNIREMACELFKKYAINAYKYICLRIQLERCELFLAKWK